MFDNFIYTIYIHRTFSVILVSKGSTNFVFTRSEHFSFGINSMTANVTFLSNLISQATTQVKTSIQRKIFIELKHEILLFSIKTLLEL